MQKQVKTKRRVADHGEVFTNEREVNAMLDLVKQETERTWPFGSALFCGKRVRNTTDKQYG